ncbi:MAG TPA: GNAT family N-acetyltransferase [Acidimicrobiales bacterium]|jgi:predicted GNAT family acetyltransferase|nr:GNAT family N-acetyltransferase [Acidimicrobiales bacterium]
MTDHSDTVQVVDVPAEDRFVVKAEGMEAELVYRVSGNQIFLLHTEVPEALGGRGIAGQLVRASIRRAESDHLTVVPWCPYARRWLKEHPDEAGGVHVDFTIPPPAEG